jgi:hypothetical protein
MNIIKCVVESAWRFLGSYEYVSITTLLPSYIPKGDTLSLTRIGHVCNKANLNGMPFVIYQTYGPAAGTNADNFSYDATSHTLVPRIESFRVIAL